MKIHWTIFAPLVAGLAACVPDEANVAVSETASLSATGGSQRSSATSTAPSYFCAADHPSAAPVGTFDGSTIPLANVDLRNVPQTTVPFDVVDVVSGLTYLYGIETADYNCDGLWDISFFDSWTSLSTDPEGAVGYLHTSGNAPVQITERDTWPGLIQSGLYLFERHKAMDINGDGFLDIIGAGNSNSAFIAYLNPGATDPGAMWERRYLHTLSPGPINLTLHDMDGDGLTDVVITMRVNSDGVAKGAVGGLGWLKNPGPTSSERWIKQTIGPSDDLMDPRNLQVADFDGNGKPDVLVSDASTGLTSTYFQTAAGTWERDQIQTVSYHGHFGTSVDENGDGVPEVLQPGYQRLNILRFDPARRSWNVQTLANFELEEQVNYVADVAVADIDRDGIGDIVFSVGRHSSSRTDPRRGGVFMMRKANDWKIEAVAQGSSSLVELKLVDFNGDGTTDIVANYEYPENKLVVYYQVPSSP